jgi:hypothetical protein
MKINEIITIGIVTEGKLRKDSRYSLPNMRIHPDLDNSSPYKAYRFGIALAGAPAETMDPAGPIGQKMITIGYTEADDQIVQSAEKIMNSKSRQLTSDGSKEVPLVNKQSPIQARKKNKYGV